jgi:DNA-binding GntR family transcriptional regulator
MTISSFKRDEMSEGSRQAPLYALITQVLRKAIAEGSIAEGSVILEGPVADILRSTRTPVRQALHELEEEGLVSRFDGRGYVAGPAGVEPRRVSLTPEMLGIGDGAEPLRKTRGWEAIYDEVEHEVVHLSVFEQYRVNEIELARHFGVGRMVARDVLLRLESLGLLEKDERLRWAIKPLDDGRINHLYELRWLLEPAALRGAAGALSVDEVDAARRKLRQAMKAYPKITREAMDDLEHDLHVALLERCPNRDLLQSLERTRCILTLSKHVLGTSMPMPRRDPFMSEHLAILEAVRQGDLETSQSLLRKHLEDSCLKVIERVGVLRRTYARPALPYITER